MRKDRTMIPSETTYGLCQAQKAVKGNTIGREFDALLLRDTELVIIQPQACNVDVVRDNSTRNLPGAVHDTELLTGFDKRAGRLRSKEVVVSLWKVISGLHQESDTDRASTDAASPNRSAVLGADPGIS